MRSVRFIPLTVAIALHAISPSPSFGQAQPVGVVTTLTGHADVTRATLSQPLVLKFKDDVFERDRIATGEKSIIRVLLGGKAIVTVRELSVLTITEEPGKATIDLQSGKIGVAVAKQRMRPGESLDVRTPNAVAAVRGTVFFVEVQQVGTSQATPGGPGGSYVTKVDVQAHPPGTPPGTPPNLVAVTAGTQTTNVPGGSGINATGNTLSQLRAFNPGAVSGLTTSPGSGGPSTSAATARAIENGVTQAGALASLVSPGPPLQTQPGQLGPQPTSVPPAPNNATTGTTAEQIESTSPLTVPPPSNGGGSGGGNGGGTGGDGGGNGGGNGGGAGPKNNVLLNSGFESNSLSGWTPTGAVSVISNFGSIQAPEGSFMALLHSSTGAVLAAQLPVTQLPHPVLNQNNVIQNATNGSALSQAFTLPSGGLFTVKVILRFLTTEFPSFFNNGNSGVNDTGRAYIMDPAGKITDIARLSLNESFTLAGPTSGESADANGFFIGPTNGVTPFVTTIKQWAPEGAGTSTFFLDVHNVGDQAVPSALLADGIMVGQDPPLHFLRRGDSLVRTGTDPLLQLTGGTHAFDSLLVVCCDGRASLAGPLLHATDTGLDVPWSLLAVLQGGAVTSSWSGALARLEGGTYNFGAAGVPMFDLYGTDTAVDAETGLTVGTHRPLQHGGPLLEASNATVNASQAVRVDQALLEATAPLIALTNRSALTTTTDAVSLSYQAKVTSLGSLVKLDRSTLTVKNGAALSVAGGSALAVTGDLFSLSNGSTLRVLNGPLLSLTGGSLLNVNGALIGFGGSAGNLVSVTNSFCPCTTIGGIPVSLTGGALASNVSITGAIKNPNLGSVSLSPSAALIRVDGAGTKVTIGGK